MPARRQRARIGGRARNRAVGQATSGRGLARCYRDRPPGHLAALAAGRRPGRHRRHRAPRLAGDRPGAPGDHPRQHPRASGRSRTSPPRSADLSGANEAVQAQLRRRRGRAHRPRRELHGRDRLRRAGPGARGRGQRGGAGRQRPDAVRRRPAVQLPGPGGAGGQRLRGRRPGARAGRARLRHRLCSTASTGDLGQLGMAELAAVNADLGSAWLAPGTCGCCC